MPVDPLTLFPYHASFLQGNGNGLFIGSARAHQFPDIPANILFTAFQWHRSVHPGRRTAGERGPCRRALLLFHRPDVHLLIDILHNLFIDRLSAIVSRPVFLQMIAGNLSGSRFRSPGMFFLFDALPFLQILFVDAVKCHRKRIAILHNKGFAQFTIYAKRRKRLFVIPRFYKPGVTFFWRDPDHMTGPAFPHCPFKDNHNLQYPYFMINLFHHSGFSRSKNTLSREGL